MYKTFFFIFCSLENDDIDLAHDDDDGFEDEEAVDEKEISEDEDSRQSLPALLKRKSLNRIADDDDDNDNDLERDAWTVRYQDTPSTEGDLHLQLETESNNLTSARGASTFLRTNTNEDLFPNLREASSTSDSDTKGNLCSYFLSFCLCLNVLNSSVGFLVET